MNVCTTDWSELANGSPSVASYVATREVLDRRRRLQDLDVGVGRLRERGRGPRRQHAGPEPGGGECAGHAEAAGRSTSRRLRPPRRSRGGTLLVARLHQVVQGLAVVLRGSACRSCECSISSSSVVSLIAMRPPRHSETVTVPVM